MIGAVVRAIVSSVLGSPTVLSDRDHQPPRYDLLDPAGRNQHFHLIDREEAIDHSIAPAAFPLHPDHLCRKHFADNERLTGMMNLARCFEGGYHVEVDNDCLHGCTRCRAEQEKLARLSSGVLQQP